MNQLNPDEMAITDSLEKLKQVEPTEKNYQAMETRIDQLIKQQTNSHKPTKGQWLETVGAWFNPRTMLAGVTATLAFVVTSFVLLTSTSSPAFAEVVSFMQTAKTMRYESSMSVAGEPIMGFQVLYQNPDKLRVETQPLIKDNEDGRTINILDLKNGNGLMLFPGPKMAVPFQFDPKSQQTKPEQDPLYWFKLIKDYQGEVTLTVEKVINGFQAVGYQIEEEGMLITIWARKSDALPLKFEMHSAASSNPEQFELSADLFFGESLAPQLFSLTVPAGYNQQTED